MKNSAGYVEICKFPICPAAVHGKYDVTEAPAYIGCDFMNYKGTFSIVLFGVEDATYKFLYVNIDCQVRLCVGDVFRSTDFQ
jgi:hypothetical protein